MHPPALVGMVLAVAVAFGGCALNPFCSVMTRGDFCPALYRMNEAPAKSSEPPMRMPARAVVER